MLRLLLAVFLCAACSCASRPPQAAQPPTGLPAGAQWQQVTAYLTWPEGREADFAAAMLVAHRVYKPALEKFGASIYLWRIHQRAARDGGGHQVTFFAFMPEREFNALEKSVTANPIFAELRARRVIERAVFRRADGDRIDEPAALGDAAWPGQLQDAWPLFANGASAAWLTMVDSFASARCEKESRVDVLRPCFEKVFRDVEVTWRIHGQHAFLHHLSAIFSYRPLYIKKDVVF